MVVKKHILASLTMLDREYNNALLSPDPNKAVYFSKLAIIEYCGWLEETMDAIIAGYAKGKVKTNPFIDSLKSKIEKTSGFQYKRHFRPLLVHVVGIIRCERIQNTLDSNGDLTTLESELDNYVEHRNKAAHTHINKVLPRYPSPSATIGSLQTVYPILKRIYGLRNNGIYV